MIKFKPAKEQVYFTPLEIAARLRVGLDKVKGWIKSGELKAVNAASGKKEKYRIHRDSLAKFEELRTVSPVAASVAASRRKRLAKPKINFFPECD